MKSYDKFQILILPTLSVRVRDRHIFKHLKCMLYKSTQDRQSDSAEEFTACLPLVMRPTDNSSML